MILHRVSAHLLELEAPKGDPEFLRLLSVVGVPPDFAVTIEVTIHFTGVDEQKLYEEITEEARAQLAERKAQHSIPF